MQTFVTGYQYGVNNQFIGQYIFETHADFEPHLPPNTVLVAPPEIPEGMEAIWSGETWTLQDNLSIPEAPIVETKIASLEVPVIPIPEPVLTPVPEYIPAGTPLITTE